MTMTVEAVYENGMFKPKEPLPFREQQKVCLQVDTMKDGVRRVRATAGLIPCTNDKLIEWAATDVERDFPSIASTHGYNGASDSIPRWSEVER